MSWDYLPRISIWKSNAAPRVQVLEWLKDRCWSTQQTRTPEGASNNKCGTSSFRPMGKYFKRHHVDIFWKFAWLILYRRTAKVMGTAWYGCNFRIPQIEVDVNSRYLQKASTQWRLFLSLLSGCSQGGSGCLWQCHESLIKASSIVCYSNYN